VDDRDEYRPGYKFNEWELKGVPVRLELGPKDLEADQVTAVARVNGGKEAVPVAGLRDRVEALLQDTQRLLYEEALEFREKYTFRPESYDELRALVADPGGFMLAGWCGDAECEARVKAETKATIRYLPLDPEPVEGACIVCGRPATEEAAWAQAY
jgi:prolyl-tRNA synthetase